MIPYMPNASEKMNDNSIRATESVEPGSKALSRTYGRAPDIIMESLAGVAMASDFL